MANFISLWSRGRATLVDIRAKISPTLPGLVSPGLNPKLLFLIFDKKKVSWQISKFELTKFQVKIYSQN
jgi:hypothetical protein